MLNCTSRDEQLSTPYGDNVALTAFDARESPNIKNGLIIGSFAPFHIGHKNLIEEALKECNIVHVVLLTDVSRNHYFVKPDSLPKMWWDVPKLVGQLYKLIDMCPDRIVPHVVDVSSCYRDVESCDFDTNKIETAINLACGDSFDCVYYSDTYSEVFRNLDHLYVPLYEVKGKEITSSYVRNLYYEDARELMV